VRQRREFIAGLGVALIWPLAARAQQPGPIRRIAVLTNLSEADVEGRVRDAALVQRLQELGWSKGRNIQIDFRWTAGSADLARKYAAELVALAPDVIVTTGSAGLIPLLANTRTIPIVFTIVPDPVGAGFVDTLARPGGNTTGFSQFEFGLIGKWLELLKELAPEVTRVAVLREPGLTAAIAQLAALQAVAPSLHMELVPINLREPGDIERGLASFARSPTDALIVASGPLSAVHRHLIIAAAARYRLPAVYSNRTMAISGGLISYGPDFVDQFRLAAGYVDRILKGERPADLPVQSPTKYELIINAKTAKGLNLTIPPTLLARADEVIE